MQTCKERGGRSKVCRLNKPSRVSQNRAAVQWADERQILTGGWGHYAPYSYTELVQGFQHWRGLDVELLREIADRAGYTVDSPKIEWTEHLR